MIRLVAFIVVVALLAFMSRKSLLHPGAHGFWRFFAFAASAGQVLLALPFWFLGPLSWHQLISWPLLAVSLVLVLAGLIRLKMSGGSGRREASPANFQFENTARLVMTGLYRWIRHPMYSSLLFLSWGAFFKHLDLVGLLVSAAATFFTFMTARREENENLRFFGDAYAAYMKKSRMFVPFIF